MNHPITPPPELVQQWRKASSTGELHFSPQYLATRAAQWGADQELEECCAEVLWQEGKVLAAKLRDRRRPKPPSLKEQALGAVGRFNTNAHTRADEMARDFDTIRRALEALPE